MQTNDQSPEQIEAEYESKRAQVLAKWAEVRVTGVVDDAWRKAPDFPAAYVFTLKLNRPPCAEWSQGFDQNYHSCLFMMKRDAQIRSDCIELIVADSDDLQKHVDFVKMVIQSTNDHVAHHLNQRVLPQIEREKKDALASLESMKNLRDRTKGLQI